MKVPNGIKNFFMYSAGHTYTNLSRLFLRLFIGLMFCLVAIRQIIHVSEIAPQFEGILSLESEISIVVIAITELLCAAFIMLGFLMRVALVPSIAIMAYAEYLVFSPNISPNVFAFSPGYPVMFLGVFLFLLLAGPGKISVDYLIAVNIERNREEDEVLDNV
ncbi:MAG: DoxX family protein [Bacteroidales bacterium]|nr:DoxX family protein [Bacteroidales bacterium]